MVFYSNNKLTNLNELFFKISIIDEKLGVWSRENYWKTI